MFYQFVGWTWVILHHVYDILPFLFTNLFSVVCSIWGVGSNPKNLAIKELGINGLRVPSILWWFWMFRQTQMVCDWSDGYWHFVDVWWCFALDCCCCWFCGYKLSILQFVWFLFISHFWMCPEVFIWVGLYIVSGLRLGPLGGAWLSCFFPEILRWPRSCVSMDSPCPCNTEFEDRGPTGCPIDVWKALIQSWFLKGDFNGMWLGYLHGGLHRFTVMRYWPDLSSGVMRQPLKWGTRLQSYSLMTLMEGVSQFCHAKDQCTLEDWSYCQPKSHGSCPLSCTATEPPGTFSILAGQTFEHRYTIGWSSGHWPCPLCPNVGGIVSVEKKVEFRWVVTLQASLFHHTLRCRRLRRLWSWMGGLGPRRPASLARHPMNRSIHEKKTWGNS